MSVTAIVLAAGESRRMGTPKMLLPWGSSTVLGSVADTLLQVPEVDQLVVVLGHRASEIRAAVPTHPRVNVAVNDRYPEGMLTSIQCGAARSTGSLLITLGDQPLITPAAVAQILAAHEGGLTVPTYDGRRGHPVCVDASLVAPLLALPPEGGLRALFQAHPGRVTTVPVACGGILIDLDTPTDYERLRGGEANVLRGAAG